MSLPKTICVIYGLNEGPWMSQSLRKLLEHSGYVITQNALTADVVLAHSGGALLIPENTRAKTIILIDVAFWPGRPWIVTTRAHLSREFRIFRNSRSYKDYLLKWVYRSVYAWNLHALLKMYGNQNIEAPWNNKTQQIIIRNRFDEYCLPSIAELPFRGQRTFISFPGSHDDCWENPERYVNLLQSVA